MFASLNFSSYFYSWCVQDPDPGVQHGDGAGGVAAGLHAAGVPLPGGVRHHPPQDRHPSAQPREVEAGPDQGEEAGDRH